MEERKTEEVSFCRSGQTCGARSFRIFAFFPGNVMRMFIYSYGSRGEGRKNQSGEDESGKLFVCGFVDGKCCETHRLLDVLMVTVGAEQVHAEADAGGDGKVSDGSPLLHLGCKSVQIKDREGKAVEVGCRQSPPRGSPRESDGIMGP